MKLNSLQLKNFRCFRELAMTFDTRMTVIVAPNGGGKSTVLDALAHILSAFLRPFDAAQWLRTDDDEIRVIRKEDGTRAKVFPATLEAEVDVEDQPQTWGRTLLGTPDQQPDYSPAFEYGRRLLDVLRSEQPNGAVMLPVVAYYGSKRTQTPNKLAVELDLGSAALMREQGYADCLTGSVNVNLFRTWYGHAALAELSVQQKLGKQPVSPSEMKLAERARAVKEVVNRILSGASEAQRYWLDLYLWMNQVGVLDSVQKVELGLNQLSDGVQCMLSMAGDLAARCAVLNPHFGPDAPARTDGVVLIDEVDLHLHPTWQQRVLCDLTRVFPLVQFIVTTHSPQVLTTVKAKNIRVIRGDEAVQPRMNPYAKGSMDALEGIMSVSSAPSSVQLASDFDEYKALVGRKEHATARALELRKQLEAEWGSGDDSLKTLDIIIRKNEVLAKAEEV
jgi:predicted ATP-binding protein involved in virulence